MENSFETYLNNRKCKGFKSRLHYFAEDDSIELYLSDKRNFNFAFAR